MKLLFVGFGTVGQGLAELLLEKEKSLSDNYGFEFKVVGIADKILGSLYVPEGLDLKKVLGKTILWLRILKGDMKMTPSL